MNMTFTKGVGSPVYMAPEILKKESYKKAADIYSFSVTMYECLTCRECYPKEKFKFSWKIVEYVVEGNWVEKSEDMSVCEYSIIEKSWGQEAILRMEIVEIIN